MFNRKYVTNLDKPFIAGNAIIALLVFGGWYFYPAFKTETTLLVLSALFYGLNAFLIYLVYKRKQKLVSILAAMPVMLFLSNQLRSTDSYDKFNYMFMGFLSVVFVFSYKAFMTQKKGVERTR